MPRKRPEDVPRVNVTCEQQVSWPANENRRRTWAPRRLEIKGPTEPKACAENSCVEAERCEDRRECSTRGRDDLLQGVLQNVLEDRRVVALLPPLLAGQRDEKLQLVELEERVEDEAHAEAELHVVVWVVAGKAVKPMGTS